MTAFILAVIVNSYNTGQVSVMATPPPRASWALQGPGPAAPFHLNVCETVSLGRGHHGGGGGLRVARCWQGKLRSAGSGIRKTERKLQYGVSPSHEPRGCDPCRG